MVRRNNNVEMRTDTDITIIAGGAITNFVAHSDCIPANTDKSSLREIRDVIRLEQRTELKTVWRRIAKLGGYRSILYETENV